MLFCISVATPLDQAPNGDPIGCPGVKCWIHSDTTTKLDVKIRGHFITNSNNALLSGNPPQHKHTYIHIFDFHLYNSPKKWCNLMIPANINQQTSARSKKQAYHLLSPPPKKKPEVSPTSFDKGTELFIPAILRKPSGNDKLKPQIFSSWDFEGPKK